MIRAMEEITVMLMIKGRGSRPYDWATDRAIENINAIAPLLVKVSVSIAVTITKPASKILGPKAEVRFTMPLPIISGAPLTSIAFARD